MLEVAKKLDLPDFFQRLNNVPNDQDAIANDTRYHLKCWATMQRKVQPTLCSVQEFDDLATFLVGIEIVSMVDELLNTGNFLDMNSINTT